METVAKIKYTAKVRRGIREMLERGLAQSVEQAITDGTQSYLPRKERTPAGEIADLRAAVAWLRQEAAGEGE